MRRFGIISRITLILMILLLALTVSVMGFNEWRRTHWKRPQLQRASHMAQAAGIVDTVLRATPDDVPTVLRAVSGEVMRADIVACEPPVGHLIPAPHVAAKVRSLMRMPVTDLQAYTDGAKHGLAYPGEGLEGVVRRVVVPLAPGRVLVVAVIVYVQDYSLTILGMPSGFWIGFLGFVVAALAFVAALRELGPLRRLTEAVSRFDGRAAPAFVENAGASDVGRLVRAVDEMQTRVATLLRERSVFIGAISHDAKTYLTRLRLKSEAIDDPARRAALLRDVDAMTDLIEMSLIYARGTTDTPRRVPVDLADMVAADIAERDALGGRIPVTGTLAEAAIVEGDPVALRRVVGNLIDNAVKFGRSRVEVGVEVAAGTCRMTVGDDGPGIAVAERALVLTPFYRIEKSRSRQTGGTGLGLAIARQIAQAHGGTIEIRESALGGALFVVTLSTIPASDDLPVDDLRLPQQRPSRVVAKS